jgi:hypothetical protein
MRLGALHPTANMRLSIYKVKIKMISHAQLVKKGIAFLVERNGIKD